MASLIYFASPYSHEDPAVRQERYEKTLAMAAGLLERGFLLYSPIVDGHQYNKYWKEHEVARMGWDFWNKLDTLMIRKSDAFWVFALDGWRLSIGVQEELKLAKMLQLPISFVDEDGNILPPEGI